MFCKLDGASESEFERPANAADGVLGVDTLGVLRMDALGAGAFGALANDALGALDTLDEGAGWWVMVFRTNFVALTESFKSVRKRMKVIMKRFGLFIFRSEGSLDSKPKGNSTTSVGAFGGERWR